MVISVSSDRASAVLTTGIPRHPSILIIYGLSWFVGDHISVDSGNAGYGNLNSGPQLPFDVKSRSAQTSAGSGSLVTLRTSVTAFGLVIGRAVSQSRGRLHPVGPVCFLTDIAIDSADHQLLIVDSQ